MLNNRFYRPILLILVIGLLIPLTIGEASLTTPARTSTMLAQTMLENLTPEEKVGQLFLITFNGPEAGASSSSSGLIYDLIVNHHIGGVVLTAANNNFMGQDQTIPTLVSLVDTIQRNEYNASLLPQQNPVTNESFTPTFIPLFIAISQDGDGYPYDQLLSGLTALPSQMALGATWNPELARQVGNVLGSELATLGINMLLGPSLDVLETSYSESGGDLGIRSFGGDPFWVGEMGKAFITGLHQGNSELAVIAKHFPGFGGSDRLPEDEVATIRSSLEQLKQIELAPFLAVTGNAPSSEAKTDGLLVSHVRYQGFQGNIRATTRPVSFDAQALSQLLAIPQFDSWRQSGGITVSDDLGSRAVRRFYDPTSQTFNGLFVARDAFLAGNDMLYLGNFNSSGDEDSYTSIIRTLAFFSQKYREDTAFAERVDDSVERILSLKYHLYDNTFSLTKALPNYNAVNTLGLAEEITFEVARHAATLISPPVQELNDTLPSPPGRNDQIVFITDTRLYQQCSTYCRQQYTIETNSLANAVIRFYSGSGQVLPGNLSNYSFDDLNEMLNVGTGVVQIENDMRAAEWYVFLLSDVDPDYPSSQALKLFLDQRPDLLQNKNIIVFALAAPYYLDTTDISKLTAYYALYSRSNTFLEVAARLLFREMQPMGDLPVTVLGISYDLIEITSPDPEQTISLSLDFPAETQTTATPGTAAPPTGFRIGDAIPLVTGVIVDHNGHQVPDGTPVRFMLYNEGGSTPAQIYEAQTNGGIARGQLRINRDGELTIRVESEPAISSDVITIDIASEQATATENPPTAEPTLTPSITPTSTEMPTPTPTTVPISDGPTEPDNPRFGDWLLALLLTGGVGGLNLGLAKRFHGLRWSVRSALLTMMGGLLAYSYLAVGLPGSQGLITAGGTWSVIGMTFLGALLGAGSMWIWHFYATRPRARS
jgi:beta-N-acetylhexosaminidase